MDTVTITKIIKTLNTIIEKQYKSAEHTVNV